MSRLVLDEPIAGSKYRLVLDEPIKFNLVPDEPSDKPKPSLFKKTVREYSAQLADLLKVPSALTGLPHLPMESELATETIPHIAGTIVEKVTTPIGTFSIPQLGTKYTKSGIPLPKITSGEISPTPLDIGFMATLGMFGIKDISQRIKFNNILSKRLNLPKQGLDKVTSDLKLNTLKFVALKAKEAGRPLSVEFLQKHLGEKLAPRYNPKLYAAELAKRVKGETYTVTKPLSLPAPSTKIPVSPVVTPKAPAIASPVIPPVSVVQPPPSTVPIVPMPKATPVMPITPEAKLDIARLPDKPVGEGKVMAGIIELPKEAVKLMTPKVKTLIGAVIKAGGIDPQILAKDYNLKEWKEEGLMGVLRKGGRQLDDLYDELVGQNLILPAPETINPSDWVVQQLKESKGKFLENTKEFEKQLEQQYQQFIEGEKAKGVTDEDVAREQREIEAAITEEIAGKTDEAVISESEWGQAVGEFEKRISTVTTIDELKDIAGELSQEFTEYNKSDISRLFDRLDQRQQEIQIRQPQQIVIPGTEPKMPELKLRPPAKTGLFQETGELFKEEIGLHQPVSLIAKARQASVKLPKDFYEEEIEIPSGTFAREPSRPREIDVTHIAKTPEEWKKTIEQLNKFGQMQSILRRTGGIAKKQAVGQFVRPGKGKLTKRVLPTGEVRLRSEYIEPPFNYASVLAHELGHALEWNLLKSINKETFKVFGDDLTLDIIAKIKDELIAVTKALEGEAAVSGNPRYYLQKTELLARFMQKMIESPGNLGEIAPTAWDNFQKQAIKHPIIGEFLEAMRETIDKGQTKFYILPDLREMHLSQLGKRAGELAYGDVLAYQALKERAKTVLERFLNTKFKGIKDSPELLFNAAESIKVTKSGKPDYL